MEPKEKNRRIIFWMFFLLFDVLVAYAIAEVWVRAFVPVQNICWQIDNQIGAQYCANQRTYGYVEKGYANIFITNSMGFHDIERKREKDKGTFRIHIYGDSMIGGTQVQIDETINAYVENYLNAQNLPYRVEVLNMAAGDESTSSQILTYEKIGRHYQPDMVVCYFMNDFPENVFETHRKIHIPYHKISHDGELQYIPPVPKNTLTRWEKFKRTSRLYRLVANKILESKEYHDLKKIKQKITRVLTSLFSRGKRTEKSFEDSQKDTMYNICWPLTLRLINNFRNIAEEDGAQFILVDGMQFNDVTVGERYSNQDFEAVLRKDRINYVLLYRLDAEMRRPENYKKFVFKDNHFRQIGNERIGIELGKKLLAYMPRRD